MRACEGSAAAHFHAGVGWYVRTDIPITFHGSSLPRRFSIWYKNTSRMRMALRGNSVFLPSFHAPHLTG